MIAVLLASWLNMCKLIWILRFCDSKFIERVIWIWIWLDI